MKVTRRYVREKNATREADVERLQEAASASAASQRACLGKKSDVCQWRHCQSREQERKANNLHHKERRCLYHRGERWSEKKNGNKNSSWGQ